MLFRYFELNNRKFLRCFLRYFWTLHYFYSAGYNNMGTFLGEEFSLSFSHFTLLLQCKRQQSRGATLRAWSFPCYFRILRHWRVAKCRNNTENSKICWLWYREVCSDGGNGGHVVPRLPAITLFSPDRSVDLITLIGLALMRHWTIWSYHPFTNLWSTHLIDVLHQV